jgi:hypothetical protein
MVDGARQRGLLVHERAYRKQCNVSEDHANGTVHQMGRVWALLTYRRRALPRGARVHTSVRRRTRPPTYTQRLSAEDAKVSGCLIRASTRRGTGSR